MNNNNISAYDMVRLARSPQRPKSIDFIRHIINDFYELSGDREGGEDAAIIGGIGFLGSRPVTVIGHNKGKDVHQNICRNFGMPNPSGFRKALRLMRQAEKFGRPVITFIDTPGAYPGKSAEENGQSVAIAQNLAAMSTLETPIICIVTGEGSSGGALAIGVGDEIWMLENAIYSVLSPEGLASILWKDPSRVEEACKIAGMTAEALKSFGIIDRIIKEPENPQSSFALVYARLKKMLCKRLAELCELPVPELLEKRQKKYRDIGLTHLKQRPAANSV